MGGVHRMRWPCVCRNKEKKTQKIESVAPVKAREQWRNGLYFLRFFAGGCQYEVSVQQVGLYVGV